MYRQVLKIAIPLLLRRQEKLHKEEIRHIEKEIRKLEISILNLRTQLALLNDNAIASNEALNLRFEAMANTQRAMEIAHNHIYSYLDDSMEELKALIKSLR